MSRVSAAYGAQAKQFTPDPHWTGPGNLSGGIEVQLSDGVLLFVGSSSDKASGTIISIRGAPDPRTASSTLC